MKVLTYNIHGAKGTDGRRSIARVADVIRAAAPDIVCLQELHQYTLYGSLTDQAKRIGHMLDMPITFQRNLNLGYGGEGVAIASRYPLRTVKRHYLPSVRERRGALEVTLDTPEGPLTVFCTHWGLRADERLRQAETLSAHINETHHPIILCGDLNDGPEAVCVQRLRTLTDLHAHVSTPPATFPSCEPSTAIDHILFTADLRILSMSAIPSPASDHLPLTAEVEKA